MNKVFCNVWVDTYYELTKRESKNTKRLTFYVIRYALINHNQQQYCYKETLVF